jgi:hypothetical protein
MNGPNESGISDAAPWIAILGGLGMFAAKSWIGKTVSKINPWKLLQWAAGSLGEPLMQKHMAAVHTRFDEGDQRMGRIENGQNHIKRVIDHLPGASEAHEAVSAEDRAKAKWGTQ